MNKIMFSLSISILVNSVLNADQFSTLEYVPVIKSVPVYSIVQRQKPVQNCYDVRQEVTQNSSSNNGVAGAVVGGALGGILGHQVGGGTGKNVATVAGAVIGTIAGANAAQSNQETPTTQYRVVRRCENTMQYTSEQVLTGYKNSANFKDRMIEVISEQPLKQIPVTTTYSY